MMSAFWAGAISRQDGSSSDGIHLLWTAPYAAGCSVSGYDIQRRESTWRPEITCETLTESELKAVHRDFRVTTRLAEVSVRATECPRPTGDAPDSPAPDDGNGGDRLHCIDLSKQQGEHGTADRVDGVQLAAFDAAGARDAHVVLRTSGGFRGVDCDHRLELLLPGPTARVVLTLVHFSRRGKLTALSVTGAAVASATMTAAAGHPETITLMGAGITRIEIAAPQNETLLLRLCWEPGKPRETESCATFDDIGAGEHANPLRLGDATFTAYTAPHVASPHTAVRRMDSLVGLDCGTALGIALAHPVASARITIVAFARPASVRARLAIGRFTSPITTTQRGQPETLTLSGPDIVALEIVSTQDKTLLTELCVPAVQDASVARAPARNAVAAPAAPQPAATTALLVSRPPTCLRYRIALGAPHEVVRVTASVPAVLAIALREGKAVGTRSLDDASAVQTAEFLHRGVDEVLLYTARAISGLTICVDVIRDPADEDAEWKGVPYIARHIQLPVREVNAALATAADERALATSRLVSGETLDATAFAEMAETMNETAATGGASPMWYTMRTRQRVADPFIEVRPWPYALSLTTDAAWRRALGFGYLDKGGGLVAGASYDYRVTGHFRRRDLEEELLGFHTIPGGTTLPATFHLHGVRITSATPRTVELYPPVPTTVLRRTARKGIRFSSGWVGLPSLTIAFAAPVVRVALELEPALVGALTFEAKTTDYILGLSGTVFSGAIAAQPRVTLDFAEPADTITLRGDGFLYGIRVLSASSGDPDDIVDVSVVVPAVAYVPTAPPAPPPVLGTTNLQQPILPGDPQVTTQSPPESLGFMLHWIPPAPSGGSPPIWPPDLSSAPPFDVMGFQIERRRVDTGGPYEEIDGSAVPTVFFGNRGTRADPPALEFGMDVLDVFPEVVAATPPVDPWITVDDVLRSAARPAGPPPGSRHQYRIFSVDAIGRRSAAPTVGSVVRLEKRIPPPRPPGPGDTPPAGVVRPAGVRARVLQRSDPDLPADDVTLLGASTNAIVLEWGWGADERARDPFATEFRVYWQPVPPDLVHGTLIGPATLAGGVYAMSCTLDQPLPADAMKGTYVRAPQYPFKVASHTAGTNITMQFEPSVLHPGTIPDGATFQFTPMLSGAELRSGAWPERTAVIAIDPAAPPPFVFRDRLTLDAAHPRARVWVGVSASDGQTYIPDERPAATLNGGRPGNESSIAVAIAEARFIGRPMFVVPPPLAAVPEDVSPEPVGPTVAMRRNLPALIPAVAIPAGHTVILDRLEVGALAAAMSRRADGSIGVAFPDGTTTSYVLGNPRDQTALREQIGTGEAGRIENRFLMDLLLRYPAEFESLWKRATPIPFTFGAVTDTLPSKAERWLHRIRLVDQSGHISEGAAIVPRLTRVASTRAPSAPELRVANSDTDALDVSVRARDAFDLKWLVLFTFVAPDPSPLDERVREKAQLLRIPDRRDLYPGDGIRLRLADGTLLAPAATVDVAADGVVDTPDVRVPATLTPGFAKRVSVWAVTMTRDGIPSRYTGPQTAHTGPTPLVVPVLAVSAAGVTDTATWPAPAVPAEISLERSTDAGGTWTRVSPWLPPNATTFSLSGAGARLYRLALRGTSGQSATTGAPVAPV